MPEVRRKRVGAHDAWREGVTGDTGGLRDALAGRFGSQRLRRGWRIRLERQALLLADLEHTVPVPVHDEGDDLVDLLVVQLAALGATPGGHRVARRREGTAARDRVRQELADCVVVGLLAGLGVVVLPGRRAAGAVLVVRTVQRKPDTDIALTALP